MVEVYVHTYGCLVPTLYADRYPQVLENCRLTALNNPVMMYQAFILIESLVTT